jgi:hypothetical protein
MTGANGASESLDKAVRFGIVCAFLCLVLLSFTKNVNWDEFYFLSHVHAFIDGRLDRPLQTFFVRGFVWLDQIPGKEMGQILAARFVMVGMVGITTFSIHRIVARLTDINAANIAVFAFLVSGFVLPHAASFRADPIAAALLTSAMAFVLTTQMRVSQVIIVATLSALALLVTIKSALFAPAFLSALIWRWSERGVVLSIFLSGFLALIIFAGLYAWHASGINAAPGHDTTTNVREAATTGLLRSGLFPQSPTIAAWVVLSVAPIMLAVSGILAVKDRRSAIFLILMAAPVLSVVFYRNAFPYFFPFAVPLLMISVAFGAQFLRRSAWLPRLVILMFATGALQFGVSLTEGKSAQRETLAEVHRLFPAPVPYIDDSNMVATFPSIGPFMSSWGMKNYRDAGSPVFGPLIAANKPPLLVTNKWTLISTMFGRDSGQLLPEDERLLQETFVHYSGAIWLAGREFTLTQNQTQVQMPYAGQYRVETTAPITINGQSIGNGDVVALGPEIVIVGSPDTSVKLIWDTGILPLTTPLPITALYADFWVLRL